MKIVVNGQTREVPERARLADLVEELGIRPDAVVVERNGSILTRADFESTTLTAGDRLELIRFVGGG